MDKGPNTFFFVSATMTIWYRAEIVFHNRSEGAIGRPVSGWPFWHDHRSADPNDRRPANPSSEQTDLQVRSTQASEHTERSGKVHADRRQQ